jgi:hypothetical protein
MVFWRSNTTSSSTETTQQRLRLNDSSDGSADHGSEGQKDEPLSQYADASYRMDLTDEDVSEYGSAVPLGSADSLLAEKLTCY